jgi:hypothetical protein
VEVKRILFLILKDMIVLGHVQRLYSFQHVDHGRNELDRSIAAGSLRRPFLFDLPAFADRYES